MSVNFSHFNLDADLYKGVAAVGYSTPTPIQAAAIPTIMAGNDLVACAQTGTGKTAAFVLPALHNLSQAPKKSSRPRVLILSPTRELASQITKAAIQYGKFCQFNMASLVGGMSYRQQLKELSRPVDVVVATPGRLLDHLENRRLNLSDIQMLVLDEADRMLDMGFIDDVTAIAKATPANRQTLLFSATIDNRLATVVKQLLKNPERIDLSGEKISAANIKQEFYVADHVQHKARLLDHFLENGNIFKAIIFTATKIDADRVAKDLRDKGFPAAALHGDLKQSVRNRTIEQLRSGKVQFVVATDVAARGLDIADMTHVINYDLPKFCEDYVHRIGRTGRAGKNGVAISFVTSFDIRHIQKIERYTKLRFELSTVDGLEPSKSFDLRNPNPPRSGRPKRGGGGGSRFRDAKPAAGRGGKKRFSDNESRAPRRARSDRDDAGSFESRRDTKPRRRDDSASFEQPRRTRGNRDDAGSFVMLRDAKPKSRRRDDSAPFEQPRRARIVRDDASSSESRRNAKPRQGNRFESRGEQSRRSRDVSVGSRFRDGGEGRKSRGKESNHQKKPGKKSNVVRY